MPPRCCCGDAGTSTTAIARTLGVGASSVTRALARYDAVADSLRSGADGLLDLQADQPWGQPYAPADGWDWGSNGRLLNNLVVLRSAHLLTGDPRYRDGVISGMDYLRGRNALGQNYITGYGIDHTRTSGPDSSATTSIRPRPRHHRARWLGANSRPAPDFPYDSRLLGLPPQCCYLDEPTSEVANDVCIRWNAPLAWVMTYHSCLTQQPSLSR